MMFRAPKEILNSVLGISEESEEDEPEEEIPSIEVWSDCLPSVEVFQRCQPELLAGMSGIVWSNMKASEVESSCRMLHIPEDLWPQVIDDVQFMAAVVSKIRNEPSRRESPPPVVYGRRK